MSFKLAIDDTAPEHKLRPGLVKMMSYACAALAVPLYMWSAHLTFESLGKWNKDYEAAEAFNKAHPNGPKKDAGNPNFQYWGFLAAGLLGFAAQGLRRKYIIDANLAPTFINDPETMIRFQDLLAADKRAITHSTTYTFADFNKEVRKQEALSELPRPRHEHERIYAYAFFDETEIEALSPYAKIMAYRVQNHLMRIAIEDREYKYPLKKTQHDIYYGPLLEILQAEHKMLRDIMKQEFGDQVFVLHEKPNKSDIVSSVDSCFPGYGMGVFTGTLLLPWVFGVYSIATAAIRNFSQVPLLKDPVSPDSIKEIMNGVVGYRLNTHVHWRVSVDSCGQTAHMTSDETMLTVENRSLAMRVKGEAGGPYLQSVLYGPREKAVPRTWVSRP